MANTGAPIDGIPSAEKLAPTQHAIVQDPSSAAPATQDTLTLEGITSPTTVTGSTNYLHGLRLHLITSAFVLLNIPSMAVLTYDLKYLSLPFSNKYRDTHRQHCIGRDHR